MLSTSLIPWLEIAKLAFFVIYVGATVGVIVGVYWEGDQFPKEKQQLGWVLLVISLGFDTFFTVLVFGSDGWISAIQRQEIASLEMRLASRSLTAEQQAFIETALKAFAGQQYSLSVAAGTEPSALLCVLDGILTRAGWKPHKPIGSITVGTDCGAAALNSLSGIDVRRGPNASAATIAAINALGAALASTDAAARLATDPVNIPDADVVVLMVGAKP